MTEEIAYSPGLMSFAEWHAIEQLTGKPFRVTQKAILDDTFTAMEFLAVVWTLKHRSDPSCSLDVLSTLPANTFRLVDPE